MPVATECRIDDQAGRMISVFIRAAGRTETRLRLWR